MKNSGRKHFNKKVIALVLALSMLFSQNALVYATEGGNAVSENGTVEAPVQTPAEEEATTPEAETPAEQPAQEPQEVNEPAGEEAAPPEEAGPVEETAASENEAEPEQTLSEDEAEPEEAAASENKISDNTISLSGGTISVSINHNDYKTGESVSRNLSYAKGVTVSQLDINGLVGEPIGFDFKVLSSNTASSDTILVEGTDYKATWLYKATGWEVSKNVAGDYRPEDPGEATLIIEGVSQNDPATGYKGYINTIQVKRTVAERAFIPISDNDVQLTLVSYNRITVSNNSQFPLYITVVSKNGIPAQLSVQGDYIASGAKKTIYSYYYDSNKKTTITENLDLTVVAAYDAQFVVDRSKEYPYHRDFTSAKGSGGSGAPEDGFEKIKMKAVVNKSTQTIKVTWNPAKNLGYKYYELQRLANNEETFTTLENWKDKNNNTKLAKTSYTYGRTAVERATQPAVFQLICYDKDKAEKARYITVAAPSLLYVEQGYDTNSMEYCFSKLYEDNDFGYKLELAEKNTENGKDEVGKRGFAQTEKKAAKIYSTDMTEIKDFAIKKGLSVNALRDFFNGDSELTLKPGNTYFYRVKSFYSWHGKEYTSAPSNVLQKKAGPAKVYVFDVNGLKYTRPAGKDKETIDAQNKALMDQYILYNFEVPGVPALSSNCFVHRENEGPDAKSGYVLFLADRISDNDLKSFDLLRCDSQYGTYKKLKSYRISNKEPVKYSGLYKWEPSNKDLKDALDAAGMDIYYMQYNNFPPEKPYYYAVRGVYKKAGAEGGFGDGFECTTELDKVENIYAFDGTIDKINLYWSFDNCVKEYWIYKREFTKEEEQSGKDPSVFTKLDDYKLLKKVKGKKSGTLKANPTKASDKELWESTSGNLVGDYVKFVDKDGTKYFDKTPNKVTEGTNYQYVIVPKYDIKSKDQNYNLDKRSNVAHGMATLKGAKIKNFIAKNYGVERIYLRWDKFKKVQADYLIIRTTKDPRAGGDYWTGMVSWVLHDKGSFIDNSATVGQKYYYIIFAGSERSETVTDGALKTARSLPLEVDEAKVTTGDSYRKGGEIKWTKAARDKGYPVTYTVEYRDNGDWKELRSDLTGTSYTDNKSLDRGVRRDYRVVSYYNGIRGGVKNAGSYSKPSNLDINADRTTMMVGETVTVKVYPKIDGGSSATDMRMDGYDISGGAVSITDTKTEDDHITYTVRANYRGSSEITFRAKEHDWTDGSSSSNINKKITITVR